MVVVLVLVLAWRSRRRGVADIDKGHGQSQKTARTVRQRGKKTKNKDEETNGQCMFYDGLGREGGREGIITCLNEVHTVATPTFADGGDGPDDGDAGGLWMIRLDV